MGFLTGCSATVALPAADDAVNPSCADVVTHLPDTVSDLPSRETNAQGTGAWGDPAEVILRCGVAVPDPTSTLVCVTVKGIDWLRDPTDDPKFTFITYGRDPAVAVTIDGSKINGQPVLSDLALAVGGIPATHQCISPEDADAGTAPSGDATAEPTATPTPSATPSATPAP